MTRRITLCALTAALYATLTLLPPLSLISFGPIQFRVAEALCLLPFYFPETIPGVALGCLMANLLSPYGLLDIITGTLATAAAVALVPLMRKRWLTPLPVIVLNALVVGLTISLYEVSENGAVFWAAYPFNALTVGLGEAAVTFALGVPMLYTLPNLSYIRRYWPKTR